MSKVIKVKVTEVVQTLRTRIIDIEDEAFDSMVVKGGIYDLDSKSLVDKPVLDYLTSLVIEQHSHEGDMTEQVIKAEIL